MKASKRVLFCSDRFESALAVWNQTQADMDSCQAWLKDSKQSLAANLPTDYEALGQEAKKLEVTLTYAIFYLSSVGSIRRTLK